MEKINEIREKNIGVYTRKRDEAAQKKTDLEKSIGKEKATIASSQRNITKIAARIADLDTDSIELGAKLVSTSSEIETMEQKIEVSHISFTINAN
jgi:septal ring factor EnvC (AmiA/AmiB activator)